MLLLRIPAGRVRTTDRYVNAPGRFRYTFPIHQIIKGDDGRVTIHFGGTHVTCSADTRVLIERDDHDTP